jgi:uncharacterized protein (DUF433 family)
MYSGTGIYSLPEAARLISVPAPKLHRWLYGYSFKVGKSEKRRVSTSEPLWNPQLSGEDFDSDVIGFHDLLEARFVDAFVKHGVPLIVIRQCLENARQVLGVDYPMTAGEFKTDGKTIFAEAVADVKKSGAMLDLKNRQFVFRDIIRPSLYAGIEYDGKKASRWYPQDGKKHIVLDPAREFGSPIVESTGTPTAVLYASFLAEGATGAAKTQTARVFDVSPKVVDAAIRFEESLRRTLH